MKTLAITLGAMVFAASATAGDIYGGFGADPDLALWRDGPGDATGVQPAVGDVTPTHRSGSAGSDLFKSTRNAQAGDTMKLDRVEIYGGFEGADLQRGF